MLKQLVLTSAALVGSTFVFVAAEPPVVESRPDDDASSEGSTGSLSGPDSSASSSNQAGPSSALVENLMVRVQDLQQQVAEQRGQIEELTYQLQVMRDEQRERYIDLDQRILSLQQARDAEAMAPAEENDLSEDAVSDQDILDEYNAARELIRSREFPEAIEALSAFANDYPDHELAANAWYWLGEVHLVSRNVEAARSAFNEVVGEYSDDAKVPDALYKLGIIAQQGGDNEAARDFFQRVIDDHPDSQSAQLSRARLSSN